ncbi:MAG: L-alanine-DL-glutamate epimerase-like enolase superfamily enzyme [Gammaproteobacteria bacterium]|jgi:L-alanine-DL-glutamate epimerase-like enolase superfamily enzyme
MKINKIEVWNFEPKFRDGPYAMSHVVQECAYGRIICVHTQTGISGLGEIVLSPSLSEADRLERISDEPDFLSVFIGHNIDSIADFSKKMQQVDSWQGIAFGLETAYFDIQRQQKNCSFADILGGAITEDINDYFSISESSLDRVRGRLELAGPERTVIQLKLGVGSLKDDEAQIKTVLDGTTSHQTLLADANGGWSLDDALEMSAKIHDPRLVWEEPCKLYEDNITVARATATPVMLDGQSCKTISAARKAIADNIAASICIKPALIGGLTLAREVRDLCVKTGIRMRIDGPWCGDIASAAIINLALGAPKELLIAGCDLREPLTIEPNLEGVYAPAPARIATPVIGFDIDRVRNSLGTPEATYG